MTPDKCRRIVVSGHVQGVWYRGSMVRQARAAGVAGWVKNLPDGRVEALLEGSSEAVDAMIEWCRHGPPGARVRDVETHEHTLQGLSGFDIAY